MITFHGLLKFIHILAAATWLGSSAMTIALRAAAVRAGDYGRAAVLTHETDRIQRALVSPAVGLLIGSGIWLVLEGGWGFERNLGAERLAFLQALFVASTENKRLAFAGLSWS